MIFKILAIGFVWKVHLGPNLGHQGVRKRVWLRCMWWFTAATNLCISSPCSNVLALEFHLLPYHIVHYMCSLYLTCTTSVRHMYHICTTCTTSSCICNLPSYCQGFAMWHQCHCHEGTARAFPQLLNFDHPSLSCTSATKCELCQLKCPGSLRTSNPGVVCPCCLLLGRVIRIYGFAWWIRGYKHTVG